MKKLKTIAILIISIILVLFGTYKIVEAAATKGYDSKYQIPEYTTKIKFPDDIWEHDNLYCVEHDQQLKDGVKYSYSWVGSVEIHGNVAEFGNGQVVYSEKNNILAAILCPSDLGRGTRWAGSKYGYTWSYFVSNHNGVPSKDWRKGRSDAQEGLYYYWNVWFDAMVDENGNNVASANGFRKDPNGWKGDGNDTHAYVGQWGMNRIEKLGLLEKYNFKIKIYYLKNTNGSEYQNLIAVYPEEPGDKGLEVQKVWHDNKDAYNTRPDSIEVELYKNGVATGQILELNASNGWAGTFKDLPELDDDGNIISYEFKEVNPGYEGYVTIVDGKPNKPHVITNKLKTEVTVLKEWDDMDDLDGIRPKEIKVTLYANKEAIKTAILSEENGWKVTFDELYKCDSKGKVITYSVVEDAIEGYKITYTSSEDTSNGFTTITVKNTHTPNYAGYVEITGKVWEDRPDGKANEINGILDEDEKGLGGIKVTLKDKNGNQFDATSTAITAEDGTYTIKVNYDDSEDVYKLYEDDSLKKKKKKITETKLQTAYVEFEYDGYVYTTVANGGIGDVNKSKAKEVYGDTKTDKTRAKLDSKYSTITSASIKESEIPDEDKIVIARTKNVITNFITYRDKKVNKVEVNVETRNETQTVKYCNGDGTYIRTNPNGAWNEIIQGEHTCENCAGKGHSLRTYDQIEVKTIKNVNLGLFKREKPDLSIKEDIYLVEVVENGKTLKYKYDTVVTDENEEDVKVQFANKQTYTYRRPVSPTLIEEFIEQYDPTKSKTEILKVYVTYAVKITNESSKLKVKVNSITNCFDNRYELESVKIDSSKMNAKNIETYTNQIEESIYKQPAEDYTEIKLNNLGLTINAGKTSKPIYLKYKVSIDAVKDLLNKDATMSNAVEIESYTTYYGSTSYPSKKDMGSKVYAGYDIDSQPGNAGIKAQEVDYTYTFTDEEGNKKTVTYEDVKVLKSTENLVEYKLPDGTKVQMPQDDTDIAPSFLLDGPDEPKKIENIDIRVTKEWEDENNQDGLRPEAITVNLKNGETIVETVTLNEENNWTHTFTNLPKKENGTEINYTVEEVEVAGYTTEITGNMAEGYVLTNTHVPELTSVKVTKKWEDDNNQDGLRPESVTVKLKNGETIVETVTLNEENNWTHTFSNLPKKENGTEINYTVEELSVLGYTTVITGNMNDGYLITNTHTFLPETTTLSGIVFEDTDHDTGDKERLGDGKYDSTTEKTVENVKIELYELVKDERGNITGSTITQHYNEAGDRVDAIVYSKSNGSYAFNLFEKGKDYFMKFTYGDDKTELDERVTKIKDVAIPVNARNYKSTIITDNNPIKEIFKRNYTDYTDDEKMWYKKEDLGGYSIAVDNMLDRLAIEDLDYRNFHEDESMTKYVKPENMTAYSQPFFIPVDCEDAINTFNFGIIERPRENLSVDKTITDFQIKLANGQTLTGGKPGDANANIPYAKSIGFNQRGNIKTLLIEMDTELIQGAYLTAQYDVTVKNMNEIDYDYGQETDYKEGIPNWEGLTEYEKHEYCIKKENSKYYYYGDNTGGTEMQATITLVDYMNAEPQVEGTGWKLKNITDIESLISPATKTAIQGNKYKILNITENPEMKITLKRWDENDENIFSYSGMSISKTLANNADNTFDNNIEILTIDGKTARTIKDGGADYKDYMPGNLIPAESGEEQDDDIVKITITPPTGIVTYIIYIVTAVAGLAIIALGIIFIKKKVLTK